MDEKQLVAQEGVYPIRDAENAKIQKMLEDSIQADRTVFKTIREQLAIIARELTQPQKPAATA